MYHSGLKCERPLGLHIFADNTLSLCFYISFLGAKYAVYIAGIFMIPVVRTTYLYFRTFLTGYYNNHNHNHDHNHNHNNHTWYDHNNHIPGNHNNHIIIIIIISLRAFRLILII